MNVVVSTTIFFVVSTSILTESHAYLSEAAIKKTQAMLKSVCLKKHPVEENSLAGVKNGIFSEDNNLKCYFACTMKTMQLVSAKGYIEKKIFLDKMTLLAPPSVLAILSPVIEECAGKDKEEICQSSYNFIKCAYYKDLKSLDFLPV